MGYGLGGYSIIDTGLTMEVPASAGAYGVGAAPPRHATLLGRGFPSTKLVGMVLTQLLPTGAYPLRPTMEVHDLPGDRGVRVAGVEHD